MKRLKPDWDALDASLNSCPGQATIGKGSVAASTILITTPTREHDAFKSSPEQAKTGKGSVAGPSSTILIITPTRKRARSPPMQDVSGAKRPRSRGVAVTRDADAGMDAEVVGKTDHQETQ